MLPSRSNNRLADGRRFHQAGQLDDARQVYREVLRDEPTSSSAWALLGILESQTGNHDAGIINLRRAIELKPKRASLHNNLGVALLSAARPEEATESFRRAVLIEADYGEAYKNLTVSLVDSGRFADAQVAGRVAARLTPSDPDAFYNLGVAHWENGDVEAARGCYDQALQHDPNHVKSRWSRALYFLMTGDWQTGWAEYEWRRRLPGQECSRESSTRWDGSPLDGRTLLVVAEQGLGDTIQFVRLLADVKRQHQTRLILKAPATLSRLLRAVTPIDELVTAEESLRFDVWTPLLSLPLHLRISPERAAAGIPYLVAEPDRIDRMSAWLSGIPRPWIGIAWQGRPSTRVDRERSAPLAAFEPLSRAAGSPLISLQKGNGVEQLDHVPFDVARPGPDFDTPYPFVDTAAIMHQLDLVVTTDSAVAHLAGGLGVPTWIALPCMPEWRWMLDRSDCAWYPSVTLFRQRSRGDWDDVFCRMADAWRHDRP